jgi:hypothetical protein
MLTWAIRDGNGEEEQGYSLARTDVLPFTSP